MIDMDRLDPKAVRKLCGPAWQTMRSQFECLHSGLLSVSPTAHGVLTTIYIKYQDENVLGPMPYAVVWVKKASELVLGLALPGSPESHGLIPPPAGYKYANLTAYAAFDSEHSVPSTIRELALNAYHHVKEASGPAGGERDE